MTSLTRHLEQLQAEIQKIGVDGELRGIPAFPLAYELSLAIQLVKARIDDIHLTPPAPIVIIEPEPEEVVIERITRAMAKRISARHGWDDDGDMWMGEERREEAQAAYNAVMRREA